MDEHPSDREVKRRSRPLINKLKKKVVSRDNKLFPKRGDKYQKKKSKHGLDEDAVTFLKEVNNHPFLNNQSRRKQVDFSNDKLNRIKDLLKDKSYIKLVTTPTGGKGRPIQLIQLTRKARKLLKKRGVKVRKYHGGVKHAYWLKNLYQAANKRYKTQALTKLPNGAIPDLCYVKKEEKIAVEVEVSDNTQRTAKKLPELLKEVDKVLVAVDTKRKLSLFQKRLKSKSQEEVRRIRVQNLVAKIQADKNLA